jgi:4'-phosphopantetheinyl transferase EntD
LDLVATPAEQVRLACIEPAPDSPHWDRLLFSAKEALYKAWFPLVGDWLDHQEAEIHFHPQDRTYTALLTRDGLMINGRHIHRLHGRWTRERGILVTAVVLGS